MHFFIDQQRARGATRWLVLQLALLVVAAVVAINALVFVLYRHSNLALHPKGTPPRMGWDLLHLNGYTDLPLFALVTLLVLGVFGVQWLVARWRSPSSGVEVATVLGARPLSLDAPTLAERQYRNVSEEMAIASGLRPPRLFVLEGDQSINAFAAGWDVHQAAITVTRGALTHLNRAELQGVLAHEYSHILNGDMRLDMHLMLTTAALAEFSAMGGGLLRRLWGRGDGYRMWPWRIGRGLSGRSNESGSGGGSNNFGGAVFGIVLALTLLALGLLIIGFVSSLMARLIRARVSREREFLADASAVQFTRDPNTIGRALRKIAKLNPEMVRNQPSRTAEQATLVQHMYLSADEGSTWFATHPPLSERIARIYGSKRAPLELLDGVEPDWSTPIPATTSSVVAGAGNDDWVSAARASLSGEAGVAKVVGVAALTGATGMTGVAGVAKTATASPPSSPTATTATTATTTAAAVTAAAAPATMSDASLRALLRFCQHDGAHNVQALRKLMQARGTSAALDAAAARLSRSNSSLWSQYLAALSDLNQEDVAARRQWLTDAEQISQADGRISLAEWAWLSIARVWLLGPPRQSRTHTLADLDAALACVLHFWVLVVARETGVDAVQLFQEGWALLLPGHALPDVLTGANEDGASDGSAGLPAPNLAHLQAAFGMLGKLRPEEQSALYRWLEASIGQTALLPTGSALGPLATRRDGPPDLLPAPPPLAPSRTLVECFAALVAALGAPVPAWAMRVLAAPESAAALNATS